jgi:hypothetical protein
VGDCTAPMSTVQDEADRGLREPDPGLTIYHTQPRQHAGQSEERGFDLQNSRAAELLGGIRQDDLQEQAVQAQEVNEAFGREGDDIRSHSPEEVLASQAHGRTSSADGSLSTPDDTPSIQVRSVILKFLDILLNRFSIRSLPRQEYVLAMDIAQLHHSDHLIGDFKHVFLSHPCNHPEHSRRHSSTHIRVNNRYLVKSCRKMETRRHKALHGKL